GTRGDRVDRRARRAPGKPAGQGRIGRPHPLTRNSMKPSNDTMLRAMRQVQEGDLHAATRTLQQALGGDVGATAAASGQDVRQNGDASGATLKGEFRVIGSGKASS